MSYPELKTALTKAEAKEVKLALKDHLITLKFISTMSLVRKPRNIEDRIEITKGLLLDLR